MRSAGTSRNYLAVQPRNFRYPSVQHHVKAKLHDKQVGLFR